MPMNEKNIIIIIGDLGAGSNLLKNILLLSDEVDFPNSKKDKLQDIIQTVYPAALKENLNNWLYYEYKLRNWVQWYGVDITNEYADIKTEKVLARSKNKKIVFLTHWPEIAHKLKQQYLGIKLVSLYPTTDFELLWQIKSYIDKKSIDTLQNFSFNDPDNQKQQYIETHTLNNYYKFNVLNMFEIMKSRSHEYRDIGEFRLDILKLIDIDSSWIDALSDYLGITINLDKATELLEHWKQLHNRDSEVFDYVWFEDIYKSKQYAQN